MAVGNLASLVFYPLGGYIANDQGRIKFIAYVTFAYGAAFLIPTLTCTWQWLAAVMFVHNIVTFYFPARQARALEYIVLAATSEDLGSCWIVSYDEETMKGSLKIPDGFSVVAIVYLGYPVDGGDLVGSFLYFFRSKKRLCEIAFAGVREITDMARFGVEPRATF